MNHALTNLSSWFSAGFRHRIFQRDIGLADPRTGWVGVARLWSPSDFAPDNLAVGMALGESIGGGDGGALPPVSDGGLRVLEPHYRVRESFQKHSRTISAISDISVAPSEQPLRRDDQAEIKCIFLCDSETERKCVFEAINKALADGESRIQDVKLVQ